MNDILKNIKSTDDVKKLNANEKQILCKELRCEIINTVAQNGGHLASNLGVVELSVALASVFDLPKDNIVWDVGHQCYCHKLLTGRYNEFSSIRTENGLAGFPDIGESDCDTFTTGHSSSSVSSAFGVACAKKILSDNSNTVVVIGDGALSGGLAFEGFNNAGQSGKKNFIVILNDNNMSISKNVGSLSKHLNSIRLKTGYINTKNRVEHIVTKIPLIGKFLSLCFRKSKNLFKRIFYLRTIFENMGFTYYGTYDGHDLENLTKILNSCKKIKKPIVIHIKTIKGKGYEKAEENPKDFHGVAKFDSTNQNSKNSFSAVLGNCINNLAMNNQKICAVTAAMSAGTGLSQFELAHKDRFFDVGIAEAHALTFCAGLAKKGLIPVFAVYSTFLQRGFDSVMHDIALQNLKVLIAIDRAGFVGDDGKTHQGLFDVSMLKSVPNITVYSPSYFDELDFTFQKLIEEDCKICAIRYPRGHEGYKPTNFIRSDNDFDIYGNENAKTCIVCYGRLFSNAVLAKEKLGDNIKIIKLNKIIPINNEAIEIAKNSENILFVEEAYHGIAETFISKTYMAGFKGKSKILDVQNPFADHASMERQMVFENLDVCGIVKKIKEFER